MGQQTHTLVKEIRPGPEALEEIRRQLRWRGDEVQNGNDQRFHVLEELHFLACCIVNGDKRPAYLIVEASFDGTKRSFVRTLLKQKRDALDEIFSGCVEYPGHEASARAVSKFLLRGARTNLVYFGSTGRSLAQIRKEEGLRGKLRLELERFGDSAMPRPERWQRAVEALCGNDPTLLPAPKRPWRVRFGLARPDFFARVSEGLRLLFLAVAWLAGIVAAVKLAREPWHFVAVLAVPVALGLLSAAVSLRESPRRLTLRARWPIVRLALREFAGTALVSAALAGLLVAAVERPPDLVQVATVIVWTLSGALALGALGVVAILGFTLWGTGAALMGVFLGAEALLWLFLERRGPEQFLMQTCFAFFGPLALFLVLAAVYAVALRRRESDRTVWDKDDDLAHLALVTRREHLQLQSHLASEAFIEEGRLRMWTLTSVLRWVNLLARYWFNRGHLAGIPSIHFARYLVLEKRNSLIFLSNYDDRFDDYLGDFAAVPGVTAIWGNSDGFPRPYLLIYDGARQENLFKRYARNSQVESLVWYSAYPNLSVGEINRATTLRESMGRPVDTGSERGFFARLRRWWRPPLDDAALDALMEGL